MPGHSARHGSGQALSFLLEGASLGQNYTGSRDDLTVHGLSSVCSKWL